LAASLIGRVGGEGSGLEGGNGLEYLYDKLLAGKDGKLVVERDQQGLDIPDTASHEVEARRGDDLVLTLDESLQWEAEQSLVDQVTATGAKGGMAAVVDVATGDVLALASVDGAGASTPVEPSGAGEINRPLMELFEPGSTNKLITLSTAIESGVVGPDTMINVPPELRIGDAVFKDVDPHGDVEMSVSDILRESSNIGTIEIAQHLSKEQLAGALRSFGLGSRTGRGLPGSGVGAPARAFRVLRHRARVDFDRLRRGRDGHADAGRVRHHRQRRRDATARVCSTRPSTRTGIVTRRSSSEAAAWSRRRPPPR
jgi:cell division protein FtsI (penicillin-binding protein 3)